MVLQNFLRNKDVGLRLVMLELEKQDLVILAELNLIVVNSLPKLVG